MEVYKCMRGAWSPGRISTRFVKPNRYREYYHRIIESHDEIHSRITIQSKNEKSELRVARVTRVRYRIADILCCSYVAHEPLEAQAIARMRHRTVFAEVQVPPVVVFA